MSNGNPSLRQIVDAANTMIDEKTGLAYDTGKVAAPTIQHDLGFEPLNKYDVGLKRGMDQETIRAWNQPNYKAIGNSLVQLVTGTIGDLVGSPGYMYEGLQSIDGENDSFENWFINAGNWIKGIGEENFPIYMDKQSRETVFNPFDGEWIANSIAQFGPTIAMMAASFITDGLVYPALAARLSKIPMVGKYIGQAEQFIQASNALRGSRMAFTSRAMEGGMEAYETFNSSVEELRRMHPDWSDEQIRSKAGEAASRVYMHNWSLAAMDMLEYTGLLSGFGTLMKGASGLKRGMMTLAAQGGSEAFEEGWQYAISQEAKSEIMGRKESTILDEFVKGLGDTEMQQAMVQGALGGAVFATVGKLMDKSVENHRKAATASPNEMKILMAHASLEAIKRRANEGSLEVLKHDLQNDLNNPDLTPEQKQNAQDNLDNIAHYEALVDSVEEADPVVKQAKVDSLFRENAMSKRLEPIVAETPEKQKAILEEKKRNTKNENLKKQYDEEIKALGEEVKSTKLDPITKKAAKENAKLETQIQNEKDLQAHLDTEEGKKQAKDIKQKEEEKVAKAQLNAKVNELFDLYDKGAVSPEHVINYGNNEQEKKAVQAQIDERAKKERSGEAVPKLDNRKDILDYYKDKPFSIYKVFGIKDGIFGLTNQLNAEEAAKKAQAVQPTTPTNSAQSTPVITGKPELNKPYEYTNYKGEKKKVKIVADHGDMYEFEDENGKKFKKSKPDVLKNFGTTFTPIADDSFNSKVEDKDKEPAELTPESLEQPKTVEEVINDKIDTQEKIDTSDDDVAISQEEDSQPEPANNIGNLDDSYAKVMDYALFRYRVENGIGVAYITNHFGGGEAVTMEKLGENYTFRSDLDNGQFYTLLDKNGFPIPSGYLSGLDKDFDINVVRNLHRYKDLPVFIEIDNKLEYNQKNNKYNKVRMDIVIYPNGIRKVIGMLPATSNDGLQYIREKIFNSNTGSDIYQYPISTSIKHIVGGNINTHNNKDARQAPSTVIPSNMPLMLGVGYTIGDQEAGATLKTNFDSREINSTINDFVTRMQNFFVDLKKVGKYIYTFSRDAAGNIVPIRLFTKPVKALPKLKQQLLQAINKFDEGLAKSIVKFNYINSKGEKKSIPDFNSGIVNTYGNVTFLKDTGELRKDKDGKTYVDKYLVEGAIVAYKNQDGTYSKIYKKENNQFTELDANLNPTKNVEDDLELQGLYLHYAYNYYQFYEMDERPLQIDHKLVNTGNYNEQVNERLESDLMPDANFYSPTFSIDLNALDQRETNNQNIEEAEIVEETSNESIIQVSNTKRVNNGIVEYKKGDQWVAYKDQNSVTPQKILAELNQSKQSTSEVQSEESSVSIDIGENSIDDFLDMYPVPEADHLNEEPETLDKVIESHITDAVNELSKEEQKELDKELNGRDVIKVVTDEVKNDINKKVSRKNSSVLNKIINKVKRAILALLISASFFITTSFNYLSSPSIAYDNINIENFIDFNSIYKDQEIINKSGNINIINSYEFGKNNTYLIIDKSASLAHLHKNGELITTFEVGTGKIIGDEQTQTIVQNGKVLWNAGNQMTGAGIYTITGTGKYKSSKSYQLANERGISVPTVLHETLSNRKKLFKDNNSANNRMSYGCVNFQAKDLKELAKYSEFGIKSKVYILPDDHNNKFELVDNKLRFNSSNSNVNRTIQDYVPTEVKLNAKDINRITRQFLDAISENKAALMQFYPTISNDIYNQLSQLAYGILGQESTFGTFGGPRGKVGFIKDEILSRTTDLNLSLGITQIRITSIKPTIREQFNINEESLRDDPAISAIATMSLLMDIYVDQIPNNQKENFKDLIPLAYNNRSEFAKALKTKNVSSNQYVKNVNNAAQQLNVYIGLDDTYKHRKVRAYTEFKLWNREQEVTWFQETFPTIDLKIYNALDYMKRFGYNSWGTFANAAANIQIGAQSGTLYHEAYHVIHNMFLNDKQLEAINNEARRKYPAPKDYQLEELRSDHPNLSKQEIEDLYYEEKLADDFMDYVAAKQLERTDIDSMPFFKKLGAKIRRFFRDLYDTIRFVFTNRTTIDKVFSRGYQGKLKQVKFNRDVRQLEPKYKRSNIYTPTQYQEVLDFSTKLLSDAIERYQEENPTAKLKDVINNNVIPTGKNNINQLNNNLFLSRSIPYSVINQVLQQYNSTVDKASIQGDFTKFLNALVNINKQTGNVVFNQLTYDILRNLSTRGIVINVSEKVVQEEELGQPEDETEFFSEEEDGREAWQAKFASTSPFEKLGQKLRFKFNNIPVLKWIDSAKKTYQEVIGHLGFNKLYSANYAYNQLQPIIGNSTNSADMVDKLQKSDNIIAKYIVDNWLSDEEFIGQLYISVGQKNHPIFVTLLQELEKSKVVSTNSNTLLNKVVENITSTFVSFNPVYNQDGSVNTAEGVKIKQDFDSFKSKVKDELKKVTKLSNALVKELHDLLTKYNINIPIDILEQAANNKKFLKVLKGDGSSIYNFVDYLAKGIDPLEKNSSGIKDFIKPLIRYFPNDVQSAHKNTSGGQVYEWINANYLGRTLHKLKNGLHYIDFLHNDIFYRHSPLLKLLKNSHSRQVQNDEYSIDPEKLEYIIYSEIKLEGYNFAKEYSNMSEKELYTALLLGYYNSNHYDGTAIFPLPVHSDSPTMTGIKVNVIQNLNTQNGKKGILHYLRDAAYQEFIRVKQNRTGITNQDKYSGKFIYFDILETENYKEKKEKILRLDITNEADVENIKDVLLEAVTKQFTNILKEEKDKLVKLGIIEAVNGNWQFTNKLLDNKPAGPLLEHFVANFMLHQHQFGTIFNGDLSFYKSIGDYYKRAKQIWSPGTYLDTRNIRPTYNVKYYPTNYVTKENSESSFHAILDALLKLHDPKDHMKVLATIAEEYAKVDETDAQSYIDLYRYKEQQKGLWRWNEEKEQAYQRLMRGESNIKDYDVVFNVNKPFYFGKHLVNNQIIPVQNKNSEFVILPVFAKKNHPMYNPIYKSILEEMGYEFDSDGNVTSTHEQIEQKRNVPGNKLVDQVAFDSAVKVGYSEGIHAYNNADWRLQQETPAHHVNDEVIFAVQVRKHMLNDLDLNGTYTLPSGERILGSEWLRRYNDRIIKDIKDSYDKVVSRFDNFEQLIDSLREEVIKRNLGDQYLQALDMFINDLGELDTKLPLWHPLHLYRVEALLNSFFTKQVSTQKLSSGVTLANLSSYGFKDKPRLYFKEDGSLDYMEAYVPVYDKRFFSVADENGYITVDAVRKEFGEEALRGMVWRIPNEDKYSTFNIKIKGFLPKEAGGSIVLPAEVTKIAGLD